MWVSVCECVGRKLRVDIAAGYWAFFPSNFIIQTSKFDISLAYQMRSTFGGNVE